MQKLAIGLAAAVLGLGVVATAGADTTGTEDLSTFPELAGMDITGPGDHLAGHAKVVEFGGEDYAEVGARSDPDGSNPTGYILVQEGGASPSPTVFHGDVRKGCLIVDGNQAVAVGELPESEQFDVGPGGPARHIQFVGVRVSDNGPPVNGEPADLASAQFFFTTTGEALCATRDFSHIIPPLPMESGNFVAHDTLLTP